MFTCDSIGGTAEFNEGVLVTKGSTLLPSVRMESFDSEGKESKAWRTERFLHTHTHTQRYIHFTGKFALRTATYCETTTKKESSELLTHSRCHTFDLDF